ncbi:MAG: AMP-binding protein [Comamonas sp.]
MSALEHWARTQPDKAALVMLDRGTTITYAELDRRAARAARWLVSLGLQAGYCIAILLDNDPRMLELAWAARRAGLYYAPINHHLTPAEASFILGNCDARLLLASGATAALARAITGESAHADVQRVLLDQHEPGFLHYGDALAQVDERAELPPRPVGRDMLYSSGTTGRPKGVRRPLVPYAERRQPDRDLETWRRQFGFGEHTVYLSTAPFYHAAPLRYMVRTLECGGTCVAMERFDAERALAAIEQHRVTHSQWVPTMLARMLRLPQQVRERYDLSSMQVAIHAAAPCPPQVKQAMLDWWGDILYEYYGGSEGLGVTIINAQEWRAHPGSVGQAKLGTIHIVDDAGRELPPHEIGTIYFSGAANFEYYKDPSKTREAYNAQGWATYGDMGHVDEQGYLYISDRRADLILCGGVNLYPMEIENVLAGHPQVSDVAVVGVPDEDLGEVPWAVVQLHEGQEGSAAMAQQLAAYCRGRLGSMKLPRRVVFEGPLPRLPTGKLLRRELKQRFRQLPQAGFAIAAAAEKLLGS